MFIDFGLYYISSFSVINISLSDIHARICPSRLEYFKNCLSFDLASISSGTCHVVIAPPKWWIGAFCCSYRTKIMLRQTSHFFFLNIVNNFVLHDNFISKFDEVLIFAVATWSIDKKLQIKICSFEKLEKCKHFT